MLFGLIQSQDRSAHGTRVMLSPVVELIEADTHADAVKQLDREKYDYVPGYGYFARPGLPA